ncbi:hypothetical protein [Lacisediminihabitans sp.]|uniref:hypothetical protein n=1 Tax=Lacisediminihabitans sp. TaxID=2787631 RepID=UPI00374D0C6D
MTRGETELEIVDLRIQIPERFYPVRLDEDIDSDEWAASVVAAVAADFDSVDHEDSLVGELEDLRIRLLAGLNGYLTAAVYVRPERFMSLGCLLTFQIVEIEAGQDPDWFEATARELVAEEAPGARTIGFEAWRSTIAAGELVGIHQVIEYTEPGVEFGWVEARTVFGVFPEGSGDIVQLIFTTSDLAAFGDMRVETQAIVESLEVEIGTSA